ncbi:hypothetical protein B0H12DRAFT_382836 [Mycena haematopus]|nr:hypothetical protein B0H12DRAFT_382836 [Mycena haematopus]
MTRGSSLRWVLACFDTGNWLLGGQMVENRTIADITIQLDDGCWSTLTGIGTDIGHETQCGRQLHRRGQHPASELAFYKELGYYVAASDNIQRSEGACVPFYHTYFHVWPVTDDTENRPVAAIASFTMTHPSAGLVDDIESGWFAENLKYVRLAFRDPSRISLKTCASPSPPLSARRRIEVVFTQDVWNTECHPPLCHRTPDSPGSFRRSHSRRRPAFRCAPYGHLKEGVSA